MKPLALLLSLTLNLPLQGLTRSENQTNGLGLLSEQALAPATVISTGSVVILEDTPRLPWLRALGWECLRATAAGAAISGLHGLLAMHPTGADPNLEIGMAAVIGLAAADASRLRLRLKQLWDAALKFNIRTPMLISQYVITNAGSTSAPPLAKTVEGTSPISSSIVRGYELALKALEVPLPEWPAEPSVEVAVPVVASDIETTPAVLTSPETQATSETEIASVEEKMLPPDSPFETTPEAPHTPELPSLSQAEAADIAALRESKRQARNTMRRKVRKQKRNEERQARTLARRIEYQTRHASIEAVVEALVAARFSRRAAREIVAEWQNPEEEWIGILERRSALLQSHPISLAMATRLAMDPQAQELMTSLYATANRLNGYWREGENALETLYNNGPLKLEQRLRNDHVPEAIIQWSLNPLRHKLTEDAGPAVWTARLSTFEELRAVLRSGALKAIPESELSPTLEKCLVEELLRVTRHRSANRLTEKDYLSRPLRSLKTPSGPNGRLIAVTLAPIYQRYANAPQQNTSKTVSIPERIANTHWPKAIRAKPDTPINYKRLLAAIKKTLAQLSVAKLRRQERAERRFSLFLSTSHQQRLQAMERDVQRAWQAFQKVGIAKFRPHRSPRPASPKKLPARELFSIQTLLPDPKAGSLDLSQEKQRKEISKAFQILEDAQNPPEAKRQASRSLVRLKNNLTYGDLYRMVYLLTSGAIAGQTPLQNHLTLAFQRRWDGINPVLREWLDLRLQFAEHDGKLYADQTPALRRPILTALTSEEQGDRQSLTVSAEWASIPLMQKWRRVRLAIRQISNETRQDWIQQEKLLAVLGISNSQFDRFLSQSKLKKAVSLGVIGNLFSDALIHAILAVLRTESSPIVLVETFLAYSGKDKGALMDFARRISGKDPAVYLAGRHHLYQRYALDHSDAVRRGEAEPAPLIEGGFSGYLEEQNMALSIDPNQAPSKAEKKLIVELLKAFAKTLNKTVEDLTAEDFATHHVRLADRRFSLKAFFDVMNAMNETGYKTAHFIRMRYGFAKHRTSISKMTSLDEYQRVLAMDIVDSQPYAKMHEALKQALVRELARQTGKPLIWLNFHDYATIPLQGFRAKGKPYTLRNFYLYFQDLNPDRDKSRTPQFILKHLKLVERRLGFSHPAETLSTQEEVQQALAEGWIHQIPWQYLIKKMELICAYVIELTEVSRHSWQFDTLRAPDYQKTPLPSLTFENPRTGEEKRLTLRGLYARFYFDPRRLDRSTPAYIAETVEHFLKHQRDRSNSFKPLTVSS